MKTSVCVLPVEGFGSPADHLQTTSLFNSPGRRLRSPPWLTLVVFLHVQSAFFCGFNEVDLVYVLMKVLICP